MDERTAGQLSDIVDSYNVTVGEIRGNQSLSDVGRRLALRESYDAAKSRSDAVRSKSAADDAKRVRDIERRLFGLGFGSDPAAVISHRDAQDRVAGVTDPTVMGELMERAEASGDTGLLRAGFSHAWRQSQNRIGSPKWGNLVDEYLHEHPSIAGDAAEYRSLTSSRSATARLVQEMHTRPMKPAELNSIAARSDPSSDAPEHQRP